MAVAVSSSSIRVTWEKLPSDQENGPIVHYAVTVMVEQTLFNFTLNVNSTSVTIPNLHPAYNYSIYVAAMTTNIGPYSRPITVLTPDDGELSIINKDTLNKGHCKICNNNNLPLIYEGCIKVVRPGSGL